MKLRIERTEVTQSPEPGDPNYSRAFEGCESAAKDLLGGEWYGGRLNPTQSQRDALLEGCADTVVELPAGRHAGEWLTPT